MLAARSQIPLRAIAAAVALALAVAAVPALAGAPAAEARVKQCKDVVVEFEPEGSGGGTEIRARNVGCRKARKAVRRCVLNDLGAGWSASYAGAKIRLEKGDRRVKYLPVGGGGCVDA